MLSQATKEGNITSTVDIVSTQGNLDYIKNGTIYKNNAVRSILVTAQSDLASLTDYGPGTVAYTAGFASMWQKKADGTWATIISS